MTRLDLLLSRFLKVVLPIGVSKCIILCRVPELQQMSKQPSLSVFKLPHMISGDLSLFLG